MKAAVSHNKREKERPTRVSNENPANLTLVGQFFVPKTDRSQTKGLVDKHWRQTARVRSEVERIIYETI